MTVNDDLEITTNIFGNTGDLIDALMAWLDEKFRTGEYGSKAAERPDLPDDMVQAVMRLKCNVRIMLVLLDATCHYETLGDTVNEEILAELRDEAWSVYSSIRDIVIQPVEARKDRLRFFSDDGLESLESVGVRLMKAMDEIVEIEKQRRQRNVCSEN